MAKKKASKTQSEKLRPQVKKVLLAAAKNSKKPYLTAFQILDLLEPRIRNSLIQLRHSRGGDKAYVLRAASMDVKDAARSVANDIVYMGVRGVEFMVDGIKVKPSSTKQIALYRIISSAKAKATVKRRGVARKRNAIESVALPVGNGAR